MVDDQSSGEVVRVYPGECIVSQCGMEAACKYLNNNSHTCLCPHDNSYPTEDLRCPNRLTVPLTPRPIHNIIPPLGANLTAKTTELHKMKTFDSLDTRAILLISGVTCFFVLFLITICVWKRKNLSRCVSKSPQKQQNTPMSLNKTILASDRYSQNPMYIPSAVIESEIPLLVNVLERDHITFLQEIGEGCFGKVFKGELRCERDTITVAIKVLKEAASKEAEENFIKEVEIMCSFHHPNILSLIGVAPEEDNKSPWMVFEFMTHGDLTEVLRNNSPHFRNTNSGKPRLTKDSLMSIALQIAEGMKYLAAQRFVHRDLACRNCLVGKDLTVKIADFGMSRDVYTCDYYKIGGSRLLPVRWMSHESVLYGRFTLESDVWSYGVVLWEIFSYGKQPYFGHSNEEVINLIIEGMLPIPPAGCPQVIYDLMRSCWKTEPRDRTNFIVICDELKKYLSRPRTPTNLPLPPAFPVTLQTSIDILDSESYLQPVPPPGPAREYLHLLHD